MGRRMTDASLSARLAEGDFHVGRVISRAFSVLSRNFVTFFIVTTVAYLPVLLLLWGMADAVSGSGVGIAVVFFAVFLLIALFMLSQAVVLHGAFQDMRGRPVSLVESLGVGLRRFLPLIGLAVVMLIVALAGVLVATLMSFPVATIAGGLIAGVLSVALVAIAGVILLIMWFVATPVCVVERLGPLVSLRRSSQLTKGHRWKIFGLMLLMIVLSIIAGQVVEYILGAVGGLILVAIGTLVWNGIWGAFYAVAVAVTYHDLRVAKEGTSIEQIAAVFD
jgi:hypothetical protein